MLEPGAESLVGSRPLKKRDLKADVNDTAMLDSAAMPEHHQSASAAVDSSMITKILWGALVLAAIYICYFHHLGGLGFVGPDEPRYAWVAREMAETGDWVTPRLYGQPWFEKPVLYYWGAALAFKSFGVSESTARLPSAVSALWATLALAWLAWRIYGRETARLLLVMLPATVAMIAFSHAAAPDMPFAAMLTLTMVAAAIALDIGKTPEEPTRSGFSTRAPILALTAFGFFLGAASLAKGPAAMILTGGALCLWALGTNRWRDTIRLAHPIVIAAFGATALPWYVLCARRNPDFLHVFILEHNFARFLTPVFQHVQPFWFFVPVIALGALPWTLVLRTDSYAPRKLRAGRLFQSPCWFVLCWAFFPLLFFSLSKSKLPGYVLPSFPALVLLCSRSIFYRENHLHRRVKSLVLCQAGIFVALGIGAMILQGRLAGEVNSASREGGLGLGVASFVGGAIIALVGLRKGLSASTVASAALMLVSVVILGRGLTQIDPIYFSRDAANFASSAYPALLRENAFVYRVRRAQQYSLNFYLHHELPEWPQQVKLPALVFTPLKEKPALEELGLTCSQRHNLTNTSLIVCVRPRTTEREGGRRRRKKLTMRVS